MLLVNSPKIGKSLFATEILEGVRLKGHKAVYLANEYSNRRLQERYSRIAPDPDDGVMFFGGRSNDKPIPKDANALLFLSAIIKKFQAKLIIIDTNQAIRIANKKESYGSAEEEFSALRHLAHKLKITIICLHHTKKKNFEIEPLDSILGSQEIAATI